MSPNLEIADVTTLLQGVREGHENAAVRLTELVYAELRKIAGVQMRGERPEHSLQATALVHEAYLRLVGTPTQGWRNRAHFFATAALVMRRILVTHARVRNAAKRGGSRNLLPLDEKLVLTEERSDLLLALDEALTKLAGLDARKSRVVEMRYFAGMTEEEIGETLGVTVRTVKRDWSVARAWLQRELGAAPSEGGK